jgi:hypothetical protein
MTSATAEAPKELGSGNNHLEFLRICVAHIQALLLDLYGILIVMH